MKFGADQHFWTKPKIWWSNIMPVSGTVGRSEAPTGTERIPSQATIYGLHLIAAVT